jgi:transposase-like protein
LVVFICGCYEGIVESIICEYVERHRDLKISKYVSESLDLIFRNPDIEKMITLLNRFDESWGKQIKSMANANTKAIDSIIAHKNELAHTGNSTITMNDIKELFNRSKPIIQKIDEIVLQK